MVLVLAGCASGPPLSSGFQQQPFVLQASANYGSVTVREISPTTVQAITPYGTAQVTVRNGVISGNSDGISIDGTYQDGHASGEALNGGFDYHVKGLTISGSVPDFYFALRLTSGQLVGYVGPGKTTIPLGRRFRSLTSPDVIAALVIALPEWQMGRLTSAHAAGCPSTIHPARTPASAGVFQYLI